MRRVLADILILENFINAHPAIFTLLKTTAAPEVKDVALRRVLIGRLTIDPFTRTHAFSDFDVDRFVNFQLPQEECEKLNQMRLINFDLAF